MEPQAHPTTTANVIDFCGTPIAGVVLRGGPVPKREVREDVLYPDGHGADLWPRHGTPARGPSRGARGCHRPGGPPIASAGEATRVDWRPRRADQPRPRS